MISSVVRRQLAATPKWRSLLVVSLDMELNVEYSPKWVSLSLLAVWCVQATNLTWGLQRWFDGREDRSVWREREREEDEKINLISFRRSSFLISFSFISPLSRLNCLFSSTRNTIHILFLLASSRSPADPIWLDSHFSFCLLYKSFNERDPMIWRLSLFHCGYRVCCCLIEW